MQYERKVTFADHVRRGIFFTLHINRYHTAAILLFQMLLSLGRLLSNTWRKISRVQNMAPYMKVSAKKNSVKNEFSPKDIFSEVMVCLGA